MKADPTLGWQPLLQNAIQLYHPVKLDLLVRAFWISSADILGAEVSGEPRLCILHSLLRGCTVIMGQIQSFHPKMGITSSDEKFTGCENPHFLVQLLTSWVILKELFTFHINIIFSSVQ